jgi:carboxyl-terminal processing protease
MRGKPGTGISITVLRDAAERPFRVDLVRDVIHVASVKSRTLQPGFGYVRIAHFQSRTTEDLLKALSSLKEENEGKLAGLVLDLRNNPGGVLNSAVGVSDAFLGGGLIVYTKGRIDDSVLEFKAGPDDVLDGAPLVVLVNSGSASASEIVAGALQDHKRAIIMGGATFGKGSVQTIVPIDNTTALKLTTARYYTPSGRSIQAQGIEPDILLERGRLELAESSGVDPVKEANLARHLGNGDEETEIDVDPSATEADESEEPGEPQTGEQGEGKEDKQPLAVEDYQLNEALNVLRALTIYSAAKSG